MAPKLEVIESVTSQYQADAKHLLEGAIEEEFVTVYVVGLNEDGTVSIKGSSTKNMLAFLGAIEAAKSTIHKNWK